MRTLQRWLSDFFNLLHRDPEDPERLWTWPALLGYMGLLGLLGWLFVSVA